MNKFKYCFSNYKFKLNKFKYCLTNNIFKMNKMKIHLCIVALGHGKTLEIHCKVRVFKFMPFIVKVVFYCGLISFFYFLRISE